MLVHERAANCVFGALPGAEKVFALKNATKLANSWMEKASEVCTLYMYLIQDVF